MKDPYPVRVSGAGMVAIRNPFATCDDDYPWLITDGAPGDDAAVADWTPYVPQSEAPATGEIEDDGTGPVGAAAAEAFTAWETVYPPSVERGEPDMRKAAAILAGFPAKELEIIALAMSELSQLAWSTRYRRILAQTKDRQAAKNA